MNPMPAWLATAATCALVLVASCGGGGDGGGGSTQSPPASQPEPSPPASQPQQPPPGSQTNCQPPTVVGGNLFVAEQGPVGVTLLSTGGLSQYAFLFFYDNVFGIRTGNPQDKWGVVTPDLFPPGTPVGASAQVQFQPFPQEQTPPMFPKGIPIELTLQINNGTNVPSESNHSSTASMGKDISHEFHTASVTYGANNTATVTFFSNISSNGVSVALTNVFGKGLPAGSGSGC